MTSYVIEDDQVEKWWLLFGVALFLLVPFDLFTTLVAIAEYGTIVEANPVMRWLLARGLLAVGLANLVAVVLAVYLFHIAVGGLRHAPPAKQRPLITFVNIWILSLLIGGLVLVVNNILTIV